MKQISIYIENKTGKLALVSSLLAENGINLQALSIADTADFGILRVIADNTEKAYGLLVDNGYLAKITDVVAVAIEDKPGSLARIISALAAADISVEYTYAFTSSAPGMAVMVFRVNDNEKALAALTKAGIKVEL